MLEPLLAGFFLPAVSVVGAVFLVVLGVIMGTGPRGV